MHTAPYRRVLATPGARPLYALAMLARIPPAATGVALSLRVVLGLHGNFARSGLLATALALGMALGAPFLGRAVDRRGARPVLALTTVTQILFFLGAALLPYAWLVPAAVVGGALSLPVWSLTRQAIAALLPTDDRQTGLAFDSMCVEVAYSIGPALAVVAVTRLGSAPTMLVMGASMAVAGAGLFLLDPPTVPTAPPEPTDLEAPELEAPESEEPGCAGSATGRQVLGLSPKAIAALTATLGAAFSLAGTDLSLTAQMRAFGHVGLLGVVLVTWCLASLVGGFVYGGMRRSRDPLLLLVALAGLTVLLALAGSWWALLLLTIPSGFFCAPLLASVANVMTSSVSPRERGRALGIQTSALTLGGAVGAPLAGWAIDHWSPAAGFVTVGLAGVVVAAIGLAASHLTRARDTRAQPREPAISSRIGIR